MHLPPELIVFILSTLPILEHAAIPIGKLMGLSLEASILWSLLGTMSAMAILLKILGPVCDFLAKHSKIMNKLINLIFNHTRKKHTKRFSEIGSVLLISLIAIPLPGTGAWTGALLAFLFDIPYWRTMALIFAGTVIGVIIIGLGVSGAEQIPAFLN